MGPHSHFDYLCVRLGAQVVNHNAKNLFVSILDTQQPTTNNICIQTVNMGDQPHCQTVFDKVCQMGANPILNP